MNMAQKTFKRELAVAFAAALLAFFFKVAFMVPASEVPHYTPLLSSITWPILTFVAAAAGIHMAFSKKPGE